MTPSQFAQILEGYKVALEQLQTCSDVSAKASLLIQVLLIRDLVEGARSDTRLRMTAAHLLRLQALDQQLQDGAQELCQGIELARFRSSVSPTDKAWWWNLDQLSFPYLSPYFAWMWKGLSILTWTANLGLLLNIVGRFLAGGPGVGGAAAIALPSILALLQAKNELTEAGLEGWKYFLKRLGIPRRFYEQTKFLSTLVMFVSLVVFWLSLPLIADWYNQRGLEDYKENQLGSAAQNYRRAIALNLDNAQAHFNLGDLDENLQEIESARKEYLFAVKQQLPDAYNNLGRLYLQQKKYPQAAALLQQGLAIKDVRLEVRYSMFKNLGWVRFEQKRYEEAKTALMVAIGISNMPEVDHYVAFPGSAHCLLAQVLERSQQPGSVAQWQLCHELVGDSLNPDEDSWLHLAQERLNLSRKKP